MDILSLIPTHLASQKDRFHAASVCRHWRGVLLRNSTLWSQLFPIKGEEYVSTLLERAKGSALDIVTGYGSPASAIALISSRPQQIRSLESAGNYWNDIIKFSESILPLLRVLKIRDPYTPLLQPNVVTPPSLPLFRGSINLEQFVFHSGMLSLLSHFAFPNLVTSELLLYQAEECSVLHLLDFLKASPTLQTVEVKILSRVVLRGIPQEMVVVLPNVNSFSLHITHGYTTHVYDVSAHISCPRARNISLAHGVDDVNMDAHIEIFPTPDSWNTIIVHRYTASPIEEVTLELEYSGKIECFLTFRSPGTTNLRLGFEVTDTEVSESVLDITHAEICGEIFYQALTTIQDSPLLSYVKRLRIEHQVAMPGIYTERALNVGRRVRELFSSLGPLDELTIRGCDPHMFLAKFVDGLGCYTWEQPIALPRIKELAILHPVLEDDPRESADAIVELAKSQHARGIPFERLTIHMRYIPEQTVEEELMRWVDTVDWEESGECSCWSSQYVVNVK